MFTRSTLVHLRLPFFFFLSPVFLFALAVSPHPDLVRSLLAFFILHFLLYPSSNGFNSYYDRDTSSIGGIERPPEVTKDLLAAVNILDILAVSGGFLVGWPFAAGCACYSLGSRLYSWDRTRLKRFPVLSWLMVGLGQGTAVFLISYYAINHPELKDFVSSRVLLAGLLPGLLLLAAYPMTQVYQHGEDRKRGDTTFSMLLGVGGTFRFAAVCLAFVTAGYVLYLTRYFGLPLGLAYLTFQIPVVVHFESWRRRTERDPSRADFRNTMRQNLVTSSCMNAFFLILFTSRFFTGC